MLNWLLTQLKKLTFSDLGSTASLLSLFLTLYLFYAIRKIKSFYVFKGRVPELISELEGHGSKLLVLHGDFKNSRENVLLELATTEVKLRTLQKRVGRPTRKSVSKVVGLIEDYRSQEHRDYLWRIYVDLQKVIQEVIEVQRDRFWENPNG